MEAIHDPRGAVCAWLDKTTIYDLNVRPVAFIDNDAVFLYGGKYIGNFTDRFFRDRQGNAVAFMKGAHKNGPLPPIPNLPPLPPMPPLPPLQPLPSIPPLAPLPTLSWSQLTWAAYLS